MASKPETTFYTSVHKHLPPLSQLHREKMSNPYRGGTFDHWYSGDRDMWIEWKFIKLPARDSTVIDLCSGKNPPLSSLQQEWGRGRHKEGRKVWVVVGCKEGGVILPNPPAWETAWSTASFRQMLFSRKEIAETILVHTF